MPRRPNNVRPLDRLAVRQEEAADVFSISTSLFDQLVKERIFPNPTYVHSIPLWDVAELMKAWDRLRASESATEISEQSWGRRAKL